MARKKGKKFATALPNAKQKTSKKIPKTVAAPEYANALPQPKVVSSKIPKTVAAPKKPKVIGPRSDKKTQAIKNNKGIINAAGRDKKITNNELKTIANKSNLSTAKLAQLINSSGAKTTGAVGYNINRERLTPEVFKENKAKLINKFDNASLKKDPYTGGQNTKRLDQIGNQLKNYGVNNYQPSDLKLQLLKLGKEGNGTISQNKYENIVSNNPDVQANTLTTMLNNAGVSLKDGGEFTRKGTKKLQTAASTAASAADPATQTENKVLDIQGMLDGMQTMLTNTFSQPAQPDFASLLQGITNSQNSMFANMMNNNRIQQSQMNPMRMSPVLGIRSAGMQNYGVNNATNAFGRDGTRFGGLKNNSLNLF